MSPVSISELQSRCLVAASTALRNSKKYQGLYAKVLFIVARLTQIYDGDRNKRIREMRFDGIRSAVVHANNLKKVLAKLKELPHFPFEDESHWLDVFAVNDSCVGAIIARYSDPAILDKVATPFYISGGPSAISNKRVNNKIRVYLDQRRFDKDLKKQQLEWVYKLALILAKAEISKKSHHYEGTIFPSLEYVLKDLPKDHFLKGLNGKSFRKKVEDNQRHHFQNQFRNEWKTSDSPSMSIPSISSTARRFGWTRR